MAVAPQAAKTSGNLLTRFRRATWRGRRINWSGYLFVAPFSILFLVLKIAALGFVLESIVELVPSNVESLKKNKTSGEKVC